jgi:hypothetical protein
MTAAVLVAGLLPGGDAGAGAAAAGALRFGVYPGGSVGGTQGIKAAPRVDTARRLELLRELRAGRPDFVLHEYAGFQGEESLERAIVHVEHVLEDARATGSQVEVVLRYQPRSRDRVRAVPAYAEFVRQMVRRFGAHPDVVGFQITNEPNVRHAPDAADGDFPGARSALVQGVLAATAERAGIGRPGLRLGFNVAHGAGGPRWWRALRREGGPDFRHTVDYVGLDVYPGTWPVPARRPPSSRKVRRVVRRALAGLRRDMRRAGLERRVAIHVSEAGYPTGPGRDEAAQERVLRAMVEAVVKTQRRFGVTDFRWFDLRDADSAAGDFQARYGLLRDDLTPKPAFRALRALVARHGG